MATAVERSLDGLIVSCQPVIGGAMDRTEIVVGFALAAAAGGAAALRIEGLANVRAVRAATSLPVIGLVKRAEANTPVFITPLLQDVADLADAGADIIAFDATQRVRPVSVPALIAAIHAAGRQSMADCADLADAVAAAEAGASVIGTTLSGYVGGPVPEEPDIGLVRQVAVLGRPVFAEGRYRTLAQVQAARQAGADAVVVGSAITRPEHITSWFVEAVKSPSAPSS
ncbi:putative N-acetylmannosamine-6-phosphate 2-epimerase [Labrys sp. LIt4]|uniref:N-acetylmannosamine-6-phosphate 2-epimerase n=1 Tax=Labrys sp. LIt4 TaxID=2821355 RepID=UPI001FD7529F|nr:putative N-acetylmannosamine-6-phosphate 2-epimerase [Labrys sp. LIt4]